MEFVGEMEMPPIPTWFAGQHAVLGFLTSANGQPAFVIYQRAGEDYAAYGVQVLTLIGARVARITSFNDPDLVPTFSFPSTLPN